MGAALGAATADPFLIGFEEGRILSNAELAEMENGLDTKSNSNYVTDAFHSLCTLVQNQRNAYTEYKTYSSVLGELAPTSLREFQNAKEDPEVWDDLQHKFEILDMYKMDSGYLTPTEIFRLDNTLYHEKREKFNEGYTHRGNIAGAFLDGDERVMYYAHSKISNKLKGYKGNSTLITLKDQLRFSYSDVQKENGEWRRGTYHDTEAKLFEYFADLYEMKPFKSITMLSERGMCKSCQGVMEQFQKQFPDVTIKVVSNKKVEGDVWGYRR